MKIKKFSFIVLVTLIFSILVGCTTGSFNTKNAKEDNSSTKMSMSYEKFNGTKQKKIKVDKDEVIKIKVDIVTDSGKLDVEIENKDTDEDAYSGDDLPTSTFEVTLDKEGTYTIKVEGENHKGSYSFTW